MRARHTVTLVRTAFSCLGKGQTELDEDTSDSSNSSLDRSNTKHQPSEVLAGSVSWVIRSRAYFVSGLGLLKERVELAVKARQRSNEI